MNGIGWSALIRAWIVGVAGYYLASNVFRALIKRIEDTSGLEASYGWEWTLFFVPPVLSGLVAAIALLPKWWRKAGPLDWLVVGVVGPTVAMLDYILWVVTSAHFRAQVLVEIAVVIGLGVLSALGVGSVLGLGARKNADRREVEREYLAFNTQ